MSEIEDFADYTSEDIGVPWTTYWQLHVPVRFGRDPRKKTGACTHAVTAGALGKARHFSARLFRASREAREGNGIRWKIHLLDDETPSSVFVLVSPFRFGIDFAGGASEMVCFFTRLLHVSSRANIEQSVSRPVGSSFCESGLLAIFLRCIVLLWCAPGDRGTHHDAPGRCVCVRVSCVMLHE